MISFLDPKQSSFLQSLGEIQQRADSAQKQVSSGLRIASASDHPDEISVLLQARSELAATEQTKSNLGRVKTELDGAEGALNAAIKAVERVRVLGAQGVSGTQTAESRKLIAGEISGLLQQLVGLSNTAIDGRYLFAGSADQSPPYTFDLTTATGATPYAGGTATRQVSDTSGVRFNVAKTGRELFDNPTAGKSAFAAVNSLRLALDSNDEAATKTALADIGTSLEHLNQGLALYGSAQNQLAQSTNSADGKVLSLRTQISETEGADLSEAILELQTANTHRQAALQTKAQEDRRTVFDFLR